LRQKPIFDERRPEVEKLYPHPNNPMTSGMA
jgi:hypothetical protein